MNINVGNPIEIILVLLSVALLPFVGVLVTSFSKVIVIFGLVRTAIGLQSSPPNMVLNGMAIILSIYVMFPVLSNTYELAEKVDIAHVDYAHLGEAFDTIKEPMINFLHLNSKITVQDFFVSTAKRIWPKKYADHVSRTSLIVLVPAFTVTELTSAFQIGFILYLPFIIIDLIVSNILMALGMMMLSPTTIALPFKLLLFCFVDGWTRLMSGLIMTYKI